MRFEFATATRIVFGPGTLKEAGPAAASMLADKASRRALVVSGRSEDRTSPLLDLLREQDIGFTLFRVESEPTIQMIREGVDRAREGNCRVVIGFGGGSSIDAAKAIAAMLANEGDLLDYLEVIGRGRSLERPPVPCIAIPTTAGTGAEVTRNAVLASPEHKVKASLRSPMMLPRLAIVDPELTYDLTPEVTASTGLDALTQLIEAYVSVKANPMTDGICREGIERAARALPQAYRVAAEAGKGDAAIFQIPKIAASPFTAAREDMALASLFGGLALANAGLGAVHGFAGPIGGEFPAPHGAVCAALLPYVMAANVKALRERQSDSPALARYGAVGRMVIGRADATAVDAVRWTQQLCAELKVPPLRSYGMSGGDVPRLVEKAQAASSMKGNPITLTKEELGEILAQSL